MPGSKPGERRGGRQKGTPNKVTAELRGAAQKYTMQALEVLAHVAQHGESESARVSAACALLDRGHGRPTQAIAGDPEQPHRLVVELIDPTKPEC